MRLVLIAASFSLVVAACGNKSIEPTPATQPTKVLEADSLTPAVPADDVAAKPADGEAPKATDAQKQGADEPDAEPADPPSAPPAPTHPAVADWMSWEGGIDFVAMTKEGLQTPNVVFHIGRMVHTPLGSAASGMILYQPEMDKNPVVAGFVSTDANVGAYFGPKIFVATPFEKAPATVAEIEVKFDAAEKKASARVKVGDTLFEVEMTDIGDAYLINRAPAQMTPFQQQGVEAKGGKVVFKVNGAEVAVTVPPIGLAGGPGAVWSATGVYAR